MKLSRLSRMLREIAPSARRSTVALPELDRPLYFLPDWDDFLDVDFDFENDRFSNSERSARHQQHSIGLTRPKRLCDGVLVSLAQNLGTKGLLKRVGMVSEDSLALAVGEGLLQPARRSVGLRRLRRVSYVAEEAPTISVEQAVSLYDLYDFNLAQCLLHPSRSGNCHTGWQARADDNRAVRAREADWPKRREFHPD